jgi:ribosome-binding factor A
VANAQRLRRVADQIQRELSDIVRGELKDPAVGMVTFAGLERAAGFLRSMLGARIKVHSTPALRFVYDESVEAGVRLSHLIDEAVASDVALARPARRRRAR